jgi:hypothetical protein
MGEPSRKCWFCPAGTAAGLSGNRLGTLHVDERSREGSKRNDDEHIIGKTGDEMVGKGKWQYKEFQNKHGG